MSEEKVNSLALRTVEDEQRLLDKQRLRSERKALRRIERDEELKELVSRVKVTAARQVHLKAHVFKTDEELRALKLTPQQIAIVRQWEQPKRNAAFSVESSSKLMEAELRGQAEKKLVQINVENARIVLPEKQDETMEPVYIDVVADDK